MMSFQTLLAYLKKRRDDWSPNVAKQVVLHQGGLAHAAVAGMFQFLKPAHPVVFCEDVTAAYTEIGAIDLRASAEALRSELLGVPEIVRRVRAALENLPPGAEFVAIAKSLKTSVRSLQRHLADSGTSLREERQLHIVRAAERLLEATEMDLDAVAAQVGASSASHLVTMFRQHRKTTPGAYRAARQKRILGET